MTSGIIEKIEQLQIDIEVHGQKAIDLMSRTRDIEQKACQLNKFLPLDVNTEIDDLVQQVIDELHQSDILRTQLNELRGTFMLEQKEFNRFVEDYNADYLYLLRRAATGNYNCLITSARILKDLHEVIMVIHTSSHLNFDITPFPYTLRGSAEYFSHLGFDDEQVQNILDFTAFVKSTYGKEFEECMEEARPLYCTK
jgi:hypothetical protein